MAFACSLRLLSKACEQERRMVQLLMPGSRHQPLSEGQKGLEHENYIAMARLSSAGLVLLELILPGE